MAYDFPLVNHTFCAHSTKNVANPIKMQKKLTRTRTSHVKGSDVTVIGIVRIDDRNHNKHVMTVNRFRARAFFDGSNAAHKIKVNKMNKCIKSKTPLYTPKKIVFDVGVKKLAMVVYLA